MIRVFTTFSGYDSQCLALKYAGIPFELVGWSEIDKYAITAHNALFPEYADRNYGDVTKIEWNTVSDFDLLTWSSPCQDISQAGKQRGLQKDSGTRSSLIWHILEAARIKKPKYMLMENVAALVSQKFLPHLNAVLRQIEELGYTNRWQVLNAKDYGVPQNRERVFVVSSLDASEFYFPPTIRLDKRLKDVLESNVYDADGLSPTITCGAHGGCEPRIKERTAIATRCLNSKVDGKQPKVQDRVYSDDGCATAVTTSFMPSISTDFRIRKLTERERFRLMGVREDDIDKLLKAGISKTQMYKLAGNSIVCDVLMAIFDKMFVNTNAEKGQQLSLF